MVLDLIDRPEFQRLRRVRQLGLACLTYPGAEHSRWSHSLGVCHVAIRMLAALSSRYGGDSDEGRELGGLRREIIAAALLHDVGHGPFSHVFERALPRATNPPSDYPADHEGWSERIIRERFSEVLGRLGVRTEVVVGLINKKSREHLLAKDVISSQLDADRMDYLLRDSRATGARYGEFDLEWLLHCLRIGKVLVKGQTDGVHRLCFHAGKAIHVVEEYIQAREFMYVQVYVHKTTRAYETMLKSVLGLAAAITDGEIAKAPQPCPPALAKMLARQPVTTDEYLSLDDFRLWCTLLDWSRLDAGGIAKLQRLKSTCTRLVNREQPYRVVQVSDEDRAHEVTAFAAKLSGKASEYSCVFDRFTDLAYRNIFYRRAKGGEEEEDRAIHVLDNAGTSYPVESRSDVIRAISEIETKIYRLYYDETDEELVGQLQKQGWIK